MPGSWIRWTKSDTKANAWRSSLEPAKTRSARAIAAKRNCAPIYCRIFQAAIEHVLERVRDTERAEREANEILGTPYCPSQALKGLAALASYFTTEVNVYRDFDQSTPHLLPPSQALGDLWPAIVANSGDRKK